MKSSDLHNLWNAPDNSRITAKQYSFRLPVHVAAKLSALAEMYPQKSRTEIVGDLLSTALEELALSLPQYNGQVIHILPDGEEIYELCGPRCDFWNLANKYYQELEKEMGNPNPPTLSEFMKTPKQVDGDN